MKIVAMATAITLAASAPMVIAQQRGPTVGSARAAFFAPSSAERRLPMAEYASAPCGSALKNAALLGLGLSLATASIELLYTLVREPFVRNGHDMPRADPAIILWAGGAGFVAGLVGAAICRRRR